MTEFKTIFVVVGSTKFDNLVKTVSSEEFIKMVISKGYNKMVIQMGRGTYTPTLVNDEQFKSEVFRYKDTLQQDMEDASLVISHGGAGTILEVLTLNKPLVVVINDQLANNHQTELATQLQADQHLAATNCQCLLETVKTLDTSGLKKYEPGEPQLFGQFLNKTMGFTYTQVKTNENLT